MGQGTTRSGDVGPLLVGDSTQVRGLYSDTVALAKESGLDLFVNDVGLQEQY